jgi:hypothetical protein
MLPDVLRRAVGTNEVAAQRGSVRMYDQTIKPPMLIHEGSLSRTVDAVNEAFFFGHPISAADRKEAARWIAARQGLPGAYGSLFAGFTAERGDIQVFTGERMTSASARHILGEESCRALLLLDVTGSHVGTSLKTATRWLTNRVDLAAAESGHPERNSAGTFCCGKCTVAMWRNILAGAFDQPARRLTIGLAHLRKARDRSGEWQAFPFWYTVLALTEMKHPDAVTELRYAATRIKAEAARAPRSSSVYARRRNALARRALALID